LRFTIYDFYDFYDEGLPQCDSPSYVLQMKFTVHGSRSRALAETQRLILGTEFGGLDAAQKAPFVEHRAHWRAHTVGFQDVLYILAGKLLVELLKHILPAASSLFSSPLPPNAFSMFL
jgi:hypothetical protein